MRLLVGSGIQEKRSRSRSVDDKASVSAIKAKRRDGSRQGLSTGGGESRKHASRDRSKNCGPSSEEQRRRSKSRKATAPPVPSGRAAPGQQRMDRSEREHRRHPSDPRKKDRQNRSERHRKTAAVKSDRRDKSGDDAQSRQSHSPTSSIVARVGSAALSTFQSRDVNTQSPSGTHPQSQSHSGQCQQSGATLQRVHDEPVTQTPFQATYHTTTNVNRNFNYGDATSGTEVGRGGHDEGHRLPVDSHHRQSGDRDAFTPPASVCHPSGGSDYDNHPPANHDRSLVSAAASNYSSNTAPQSPQPSQRLQSPKTLLHKLQGDVSITDLFVLPRPGAPLPAGELAYCDLSKVQKIPNNISANKRPLVPIRRLTPASSPTPPQSAVGQLQAPFALHGESNQVGAAHDHYNPGQVDRGQGVSRLQHWYTEGPVGLGGRRHLRGNLLLLIPSEEEIQAATTRSKAHPLPPMPPPASGESSIISQSAYQQPSLQEISAFYNQSDQFGGTNGTRYDTNPTGRSQEVSHSQHRPAKGTVGPRDCYREDDTASSGPYSSHRRSNSYITAK